MSNNIFKEVHEKRYSLKEATIYDIFREHIFLKYTYIGFIIIFALIGIIKFTFTTDIESLKESYKLIHTSLWMIIVAILSFKFSYKNTYNSKSPIVENVKTKTYMLNMAFEIKEFLGSGKQSLKAENLTDRFILLDTETVKRMGAIIGTTGSGKTVQLKGMLEQQIALGGGWCAFDAKGTMDELKNIYALVGKYGRLNELFVLNFANINNSHSINFFSAGSALMLKEIMSGLIESNDPKWKKVDEDFIEAILKLLVYRRDNENFTITFTEMRNYLTLPKLVSEAAKYRKIDDINIIDYCNYVCTKIEVDFLEFVNANDNDKEYWKKVNEAAANQDKQGVYEVGLAAGNWQGVLTTLGSNYGNIFNAEDPDVDLFEIVQSNKMLWIVLPTMESEDTAKRIGKLFLGIIKSVADRKIKSSYEPKIPFLFPLDEFGSFAVKGFGRFMSKARSLGMSVWVYFQSQSQLDDIDDGKGMERKEVLNMCNTIGVMKNNDNELSERLSKLVPENIFLEREYKEKKFWRNNSELSAETGYQKEKVNAFEAYDFMALKDGEMICFVGNEYYKAVSAAPTDFNLTYQKYNINVKFDFVQVYPKIKLLNELRRYDSYIFDNDLFYL